MNPELATDHVALADKLSQLVDTKAAAWTAAEDVVRAATGRSGELTVAEEQTIQDAIRFYGRHY